MSAGEIKAQMLADFPGYEEYQSGTGIMGVNVTKTTTNGAIYNLAGQKVNDTYKGIIIKDGKKMINK